MGALPYFPFWVDDYIGGTMGFTLEMHGAYVLLLIKQYKDGPFTDAHAYAIADAKVWELIKHKFTYSQDRNVYFNARMEEIRSKTQSLSEIRSSAAKSKWKKKSMHMHMQKDMQMHVHMDMHTGSGSGSSSSENRGSGGKEFLVFWAAYPKKVGKGAAEKAWSKIAKPAETVEMILKALEWQKASDQWTKDNGQYIPMPTTYLNQRRWEDEKPSKQENGEYRNFPQPDGTIKREFVRFG